MLSGKDRQEVENKLKMLSSDIELTEAIKGKISKRSYQLRGKEPSHSADSRPHQELRGASGVQASSAQQTQH